MARKTAVKCPDCERVENLARGEGFFCHGTIVWRDGPPPEPEKKRKPKSKKRKAA